jgi:hypothetical protein
VVSLGIRSSAPAVDALEEDRPRVVVAGVVERDQLAAELRSKVVDRDLHEG